MSQFTDAEQAFIDATVPVMVAGEKQRLAFLEFEAAAINAQQVAESLGDDAVDVEYVHGLTIAAAESAGFGPDSDVQRALNQGLVEYQEMQRMIERAQAESLTDRANASGLII